VWKNYSSILQTLGFVSNQSAVALSAGSAVIYDDLVHDVHIRGAQAADVDQLAPLLQALWPQSSVGEHARELRLLLGTNPASVLTMPLTILVAETGDGTLVGFLEVDLRSHADGCNPAQPVGYIEGWYVSEDYRGRGIGKNLLAKAEEWARSHKCVEMASDALIDNQLSQRVHEALGYEVVDRCVHYRKSL
jgi:aminoglycoside 6'-N-acetyltransferase I